MKTVQVNASRNYPVYIGDSLLSSTGERLLSLTKPCKVAIISDSNVWPLYGSQVLASLVNAGFTPVSFVFSAGEASKNTNTYLEILNFLAENQLTRTDCIAALGGGVVGDIAGFSAATYLRGIPYIQIPTTLLAMVDSSVGGKTAIDLPAGKNLAGAFCQPRMVLCDLTTLNTLPDSVFRDGCAEVIKYGVLYDAALFEHLAAHGVSFSREYVIARCVELKRDVVAADEFDRGERQKLNLGHTIGHSIEARSQFRITHGQAVAIGMCIIAKASSAYGICTPKIPDRICTVLKAFHLPTSASYSPQELFDGALSDKKRSGSALTLIVPIEIGNCILRATPIEELLSFIKAGL